MNRPQPLPLIVPFPRNRSDARDVSPLGSRTLRRWRKRLRRSLTAMQAATGNLPRWATLAEIGGEHRGVVTGLFATGAVFLAASLLWLSPLGRPTPVAGATPTAAPAIATWQHVHTQNQAVVESAGAPDERHPAGLSVVSSAAPSPDTDKLADSLVSATHAEGIHPSHAAQATDAAVAVVRALTDAMPDIVTVPVPVMQATPTAPPTAHAAPVTPEADAAPTPARPHRVLYLVDASGSLLDTLPDVVDWVGQHLDTLEEDQRFAVMFFRDLSVVEAEPAGMQPARFSTKVKVWSWMQPEAGHIEAAGRSDVEAALGQALQYEPDEIYIVSDDGFSRRSAWGDGPEMIEQFAGQIAHRDIRVHTVQFYYRDEAGAMEALASRCGGTYRFIEQPRAVETPMFDLLAPIGDDRGEGLAAAGR